MSDTERQWRVLCTDAYILLDQVRAGQPSDPLLLDEWGVRFLRLAAVDQAERAYLAQMAGAPDDDDA